MDGKNSPRATFHQNQSHYSAVIRYCCGYKVEEEVEEVEEVVAGFRR